MTGKDTLQRVLNRVSELEAKAEVDGVDFAEIRRIAEEAGYSRMAVDIALSEAALTAGSSSAVVEVERSWMGIRYSVTRLVPKRIPLPMAESVAKVATAYFEKEPIVTIKDGRAHWTDRRRFKFELHARLDGTEIKVSSPRGFGAIGGWRRLVQPAAQKIEAAIHLLTASQGE